MWANEAEIKVKVVSDSKDEVREASEGFLSVFHKSIQGRKYLPLPLRLPLLKPYQEGPLVSRAPLGSKKK